MILKAHTEIQLCDFNTLLNDSLNGVYINLDTLLAEMTELLWAVADSITQSYFNHIKETQELSPTWVEDNL